MRLVMLSGWIESKDQSLRYKVSTPVMRGSAGTMKRKNLAIEELVLHWKNDEVKLVGMNDSLKASLRGKAV